MSWCYRRLLRPVLFAQDSERIHHRTLRALGWAGRRKAARGIIDCLFCAPSLPVEAFGLRFPNPVGLAAGMDKFAEAVPIWPALGFGFAELGAVTRHPQPGNPPPRLFRIKPDEALINRMGFNNPGADAFALQLAEWRSQDLWPNHPVGVNLGKSKVTPLTEAAEDYAYSFRVLRPHIDFVVVNVSSPNTPGLRQLQDRAALDEILAAVQEANTLLPKPILVKVAPDLSFDALDEILDLVQARKLAGIVATNTTLSRPEAQNEALRRVYAESGGLSGRPLRARSTEVIRHLYKQTRGSVPIIGVGGIFSADDAWEKITAGATLIQIYTGLVYEGPSIARSIVNGLLERLRQAQLPTLQQAVGIGSRS